MKAVTWHGKHDVRTETVEDPEILDPNDVLLKVTSTAICGSDLHLYAGSIPEMRSGDVLGHEFMGEVVETGANVSRIKKGQRVVVPFCIACGECFFCKHGQTSLCDNTNPDAPKVEELYGYSGSGLFGYSHLFGGYAGGQAEYVRVPHADVGCYVIPDGVEDEQVLFLTDIFPTGYQAADNCDLQGGETVAIWGAGPVGLFAALSCKLLGAERVVMIDRIPARLTMAREKLDVETLHLDEDDVYERLREITDGRGPDCCIDAVGLDAHGTGIVQAYDTVKRMLGTETDNGTALRQAITSCRKGGVVSVPGVYGGVMDKYPIGAQFGKALRMIGGQTHVHRYLDTLFEHVQNGVDASFPITHRASLDEASDLYETFRTKEDECVKCVMTPGA
ncbi:zinc-dependent alcohol dehydrogenase [Alienimonas sp. DA493]|uniref:zinc-dependent alcohol dehydrogenase n=1 Tax=Alienimonas sp. DA493 TaxID=3373605 RepID=UPI0037547931